MQWLPRTRCSPSRRSSASPGCASSGSASTASASPAASPPCGPTCRPRRQIGCAALGRRPRAHHQRRHARLGGGRPGRRRAAAGQHLARHAAPRPVRRAHPPRRARPRARRHRRRPRGGLDPVKVNAVVMRGVNDDEVVDLAAFGRDRGVDVRFIEWMPLDADRQWSRTRWSARTRSWRHRRRVPARPGRPGAPAGRALRLPRRRGEVGVIPSVTRPFCDLRPDPPHRRRPAAIVPVRGRRGRPARPAAGRRSDDELAAAIAALRGRQVGRAP